MLSFGGGAGQIGTRRLRPCRSTRERKYCSCSHSTSAIPSKHSTCSPRPQSRACLAASSYPLTFWLSNFPAPYIGANHPKKWHRKPRIGSGFMLKHQ
jgi:hypothetical protein